MRDTQAGGEDRERNSTRSITVHSQSARIYLGNEKRTKSFSGNKNDRGKRRETGRERDAAPAKRTHHPPRLITMMKWKIGKGITIPYCIRQICNSEGRHSPPKRGTNSALRGHHRVTPKGRGNLLGGLFNTGDTRRGP